MSIRIECKVMLPEVPKIPASGNRIDDQLSVLAVIASKTEKKQLGAALIDFHLCILYIPDDRKTILKKTKEMSD